MEITPKTKPVGLIGHPVEHSLSPKLHNQIYRQLGLDMVYLAFDVLPERVHHAIEGMRSMGFIGFNVTIPHKEKVMHLLDEIEPQARAIGAVNTVKNENGRLIGYNTDGPGFLGSLKARGIQCEGKRILILGAGGAARAIGVFLAEEAPKEILVLNRTKERGKALCSVINEYIGTNISCVTDKMPNDIDIIINTTSLGMWPKVDGNPLEGYQLNPDTIVCDIVYNPRITKLLEYARNVGCTIVEGIDMLVGQGIKAIEIWTDTKIDGLQFKNIL